MTTYQLLPDLTSEEYADLKEDIKKHGIQIPVIVDPAGNIIDGHHRDRIATELGINCPTRTVRGTVEEFRSMALRLNIHRRSLSREQKRELLANSIKADPQLSDRQHAERTGVSPTTAGTVREELVASGDVSNLDTRTDSTGRTQPASKPIKVTETTKVETFVDPRTGEVLDEVPPGFTTENPAVIAAAAIKDARNEPWSVFVLQVLPALKRWEEWAALPEVGGASGIRSSLESTPLPGVDTDAQSAIRALDRATEWLSAIRAELLPVTRAGLRRVK